MAKEVQYRQEDRIGFMDFPRDVIAQTRESAYAAYNQLALNKVEVVAMNFETSDYLNSAGIGLVISLVEDATRAGRQVFAYGLSSHYRKLFSMVGLTERLTLVPTEQTMREQLGLPDKPGNPPR
jgi:anti-anti-sigma regulatory factor